MVGFRVSTDMTKTEWLACTDPQKMLAFLRGRASDRKLRLFALACFRPYRYLLVEEARDALAIAERFAERLASSHDRKQARRSMFHAGTRFDITTSDRHELAKAGVRWVLARRPYCAAFKAADCAREIGVLSNGGRHADSLEKTQCGWKTADWTSGVREQVLLQVNILHDLFDDLFRAVVFDPKWRTSDVLKKAQSIYDEHAFERLPVLADALASAGCDNDELLAHCGSGKPHYRGCWVVDLILGK
jgi:hypothetical protein